MKEKKKQDNYEALGFVIWFLPALVLPNLAGDIGGNIPEIVMSMILGGIGAIIGFVLYWMTKDSGRIIKYYTFALMAVGIVITMVVLL